MKVIFRFTAVITAAAVGLCVGVAAQNTGPTFSVQTFAAGTAVSSTEPDSIFYGDGSIWVSYTNGASSTGQGGSSTIVRYGWNGAVQHQWTIAGNVDGLRPDPTGLVWALQNNDGNSTLTTINPATNATTFYTYGNTYTNVANRGFDDVEFPNGNTFLSETNPASNTDPIVVRLTTGLHSPLQISGILTSQFTGLNLATNTMMSDTITDSDSLILRPNGDLVLTGEADQQLVFIHNAGMTNQSESFLKLLNVSPTAFPDDSAFPTSSSGYFFLSDTGGNKVYKITATGLSTSDVFVDIGSEFGMVNLSTGVVTPILTDMVSPHGLQFVSSSAVPEPATLASMLGGLLCCGGALARRFRTVNRS